MPATITGITIEAPNNDRQTPQSTREAPDTLDKVEVGLEILGVEISQLRRSSR